MVRRVFCPVVLLLFLVFFTLPGEAQTAPAETGSVAPTETNNTTAPAAEDGAASAEPPQGTGDGNAPIPVSIMTFVGDDMAMSAQLHDAVITEVKGIGNYETQAVSEEQFPEQASLPPDEPPNPWYLGNSRFVLTGEFYIDMDEQMQHFQLWLWRSQDGSLVYTDELVAEDLDEAMSYMPALVSWVFSRIPQEQRVTVLERQQGVDVKVQLENTDGSGSGNGSESGNDPSEQKPKYEILNDPLNRWLYLGVRMGGSFRFYGLPKVVSDYSSNYTQGFTYEAAFQVGFRFLPFLSVQGELIFTQDNAPFRGPKFLVSEDEIRYIYFTDNYISSSLMLPILVKFHVNKDPFMISPFGGIYFAIPLGELEFQSSEDGSTSQKYEYALSSAMGIAVGVNGGLRLGPGILFLDLRYAFDMGRTMIAMGDGREYTRSMLSFALGYELALINKKRRVNNSQ
ncbi:MAG: outer membrane beta-barrel protein [Spirochaetaceae bacterium]|nr:outer membrane beta-barrel protein [Spirochaetaceae bacterium]